MKAKCCLEQLKSTYFSRSFALQFAFSSLLVSTSIAHPGSRQAEAFRAPISLNGGYAFCQFLDYFTTNLHRLQKFLSQWRSESTVLQLNKPSHHACQSCLQSLDSIRKLGRSSEQNPGGVTIVVVASSSSFEFATGPQFEV